MFDKLELTEYVSNLCDQTCLRDGSLLSTRFKFTIIIKDVKTRSGTTVTRTEIRLHPRTPEDAQYTQSAYDALEVVFPLTLDKTEA